MIDATPQEEAVLQEVLDELRRAQAHHPPYNSAHEGYAVLAEEVDELWDEVKRRHGPQRTVRMKAEVTQVAAVACRFLLDVCGMKD